MTSKTFTIINPTGFHTRPTRGFVDMANDVYSACDVKIVKGDRVINGKSLLHMLSLGVKYRDEVTIQVDGEHEEEALESLGQFFLTIYKE